MGSQHHSGPGRRRQRGAGRQESQRIGIDHRRRRAGEAVTEALQGLRRRAEARLREAQKLGFDRALAPAQAKGKVKKGDVAITSAGLLTEVVERISQNRY